MNDSNFGEYLRQQRKAKKITQAEISQLSDISQRTYQRIEAGETKPTIEQLMKIVGSLKMDLQECLFQMVRRSLHVPQEGSDETPFYDQYTKLTLADSSEVVKNETELGILRVFVKGQYDVSDVPWGFWEWHLKNKKFFCSESLLELYGIQKHSYDMDVFRSIILTEDLKQLDQDLGNLIEHSVPYTNIHRVRKAGDVVRVQAWARKVDLSNGDAAILGVNEPVF